MQLLMLFSSLSSLTPFPYGTHFTLNRLLVHMFMHHMFLVLLLLRQLQFQFIVVIVLWVFTFFYISLYIIALDIQ